MKILEIAQDQEAGFEELAMSYGTVFNTVAWTRLFGDSIRRYGIYNRGGELVGGFVVYRERKFGLSVYRDPPFTQAIGPFLRVDAENPVSVLSMWKRVLSLMADFLEKLPYSIVSISLNRDIADMQPFIWRKFKVVPSFTYLLDLSASLDDIVKGMSGERRKNISKGLKDGLVVKQTTDMKEIKALAMMTFGRQGRQIDERSLDRILFEYAGSDNSFAFSTFNGSNPIACSFCLRDRNAAYYLIGGYNEGEKHHGAGAMAMLEAIKHAKNAGLRYFDFEGSMIPEVEIYFRGFGGRLATVYRINKAKLPLEIMLKFFKRELF